MGRYVKWKIQKLSHFCIIVLMSSRPKCLGLCHFTINDMSPFCHRWQGHRWECCRHSDVSTSCMARHLCEQRGTGQATPVLPPESTVSTDRQTFFFGLFSILDRRVNFSLHVLQSCASSLCTCVSFMSLHDNSPPQFSLYLCLLHVFA